MPVNNLNTGVDYTHGYYDANTGAMVDLGDVQNIKIKRNKHDLASHPYNDAPRFGFVESGYHITFTITRTGAYLEDFCLNQAKQFDAGAVVKPGYLSQSVVNPDGSISRYQYTKFVFFMDDPGDISREKVVTITCEGAASKKERIA
jgi:hypothetical protein